MHFFPRAFERSRRSALVLVTLITFSGCSDIYRYAKSGKVSWALKKEIRDKQSNEVNVAQLTDFEWDELFLFGPYHPTAEVCKRLDLPQNECHSVITSESTDDGEMLMAFRRKGKVVHTEMHMRWHGDFTPIPDQPITPDSAVFAVEVEGKGASGGNWLKLRQKTAIRRDK